MPVDSTWKRVRYDGLEAFLQLAITSAGQTTIQFKAPLTATGGIAIAPLLAADKKYIPLTILDANYRLSEIVYLTEYADGATSGVIERGKEGTSAKSSHPANNKVVSAATVYDFVTVQDHKDDANAHDPVLAAARQYADGLMTDHIGNLDAHEQYAKKAGTVFTGPVTFDNNANVRVEGRLTIPAGAVLEVAGELRITGKLILNGREIIVTNTPPTTPAANTVIFQTFG